MLLKNLSLSEEEGMKNMEMKIAERRRKEKELRVKN